MSNNDTCVTLGTLYPEVQADISWSCPRQSLIASLDSERIVHTSWMNTEVNMSSRKRYRSPYGDKMEDGKALY